MHACKKRECKERDWERERGIKRKKKTICEHSVYARRFSDGIETKREEIREEKDEKRKI